jgi:hypothetical protein
MMEYGRRSVAVELMETVRTPKNAEVRSVDRLSGVDSPGTDA